MTEKFFPFRVLAIWTYIDYRKLPLINSLLISPPLHLCMGLSNCEQIWSEAPIEPVLKWSWRLNLEIQIKIKFRSLIKNQ